MSNLWSNFDILAILNSVIFHLYGDADTTYKDDVILNNDVCDQMKKNINDFDVKKLRADKMATTPKRVSKNAALLLCMNNCLKIYENYILN